MTMTLGYDIGGAEGDEARLFLEGGVAGEQPCAFHEVDFEVVCNLLCDFVRAYWHRSSATASGA